MFSRYILEEHIENYIQGYIWAEKVIWERKKNWKGNWTAEWFHICEQHCIYYWDNVGVNDVFCGRKKFFPYWNKEILDDIPHWSSDIPWSNSDVPANGKRYPTKQKWCPTACRAMPHCMPNSVPCNDSDILWSNSDVQLKAKRYSMKPKRYPTECRAVSLKVTAMSHWIVI